MPSVAPVPVPSAAPTTTDDDDGSSEEALAAGVLYGLIAAAVGAIGVVCAAANYQQIKRKHEQGKHGVTLEVEQNEFSQAEPEGKSDRGRSVDIHSLPAHDYEVELSSHFKATPVKSALPERSLSLR